MIELSVLPETIKPAIGYVIVEVPYLTREHKNGMELDLLADISVGDYTIRSGVVNSCGSTDIPDFNFQWDSPLQIKKGDKVWWIPNASQQLATTEDENYRVMRYKDRFFLSIPYKMLVMKLQAGEYVGLNDHVISEIVREDSEIDTSEVRESGLIHRVIAAPLPGIVYRETKAEREVPVEVVPGMIVSLRRARRQYLEYADDMELPGRWCAFQSFNILGGFNAK